MSGIHRGQSALWLICLLPIIFLSFGTYFVSLEDPIYAWDFGDFWRMYQRVGANMTAGADGWFSDVLSSIYRLDYNLSGTLGLLPGNWLFGGSRSVYVGSIAVMYAFPACVLAGLLVIKACRLEHSVAISSAFVIAATSVPLWLPTLRGMWDSVGLIPMGLAILVILRTRFLTKASTVQLVCVGILLWLMFLFRRWYAYSIVALMFSALCFAIWETWKQDLSLKGLVGLGARFALVTIVFLSIALVAQYEFVARVFTTSYSDLYAAYHKTLMENILGFSQRLGIVNLSLIAVGAAAAIIARNEAVIFSTGVGLLTYALFIRTQGMGDHHFLPVAFSILPALVFGIIKIGALVKVREAWVTSIYAALSVLILLGSTVLPALLPGPFYPQADSRPLKLDNAEGYLALVNEIRSRRKENEFVATFASSLKISDSVLKSIAPDIASYVLDTPHLASIQAFKFDLVGTKYLIATTPAQMHLAEGTQEHLRIPNDMLIYGTGFARGYEKVGGPYNLSQGLDAYLFEKQRPMTMEEGNEIWTVMLNANPAWATEFRTTMEPRLSVRREALGDKYGSSRVYGANVIGIHPGETTPTEVHIPLDFNGSERPSSITFEIPATALDACPNADGVVIEVSFNGEETWRGRVMPGTKETVPVATDGGNLGIKVGNAGSPFCDQTVVTFAFE